MKTWISVRGRFVGYIEGNKFFTIRRPEHFMRKFGGFGLSEEVLSKLTISKIADIVFCYFGKTEVSQFRTTTQAMVNADLVWNDHSRGFEDKQFFMPVRNMEKTVVRMRT